YYLAEGATGGFFSTDILLANPNSQPAPVTIDFLRDDGVTITQSQTLPPMSRTTIHVGDITRLEATAFSTVIDSSAGLPIVVERTMWWGAAGYGAHTEKASDNPETNWYFAEGSQGFFFTYFLLANAWPTTNVAHVTYFREGASPLTRDYPVPPRSRMT